VYLQGKSEESQSTSNKARTRLRKCKAQRVSNPHKKGKQWSYKCRLKKRSCKKIKILWKKINISEQTDVLPAWHFSSKTPGNSGALGFQDSQSSVSIWTALRTDVVTDGRTVFTLAGINQNDQSSWPSSTEPSSSRCIRGGRYDRGTGPSPTLTPEMAGLIPTWISLCHKPNQDPRLLIHYPPPLKINFFQRQPYWDLIHILYDWPLKVDNSMGCDMTLICKLW
jgi:hypothetical protein